MSWLQPVGSNVGERYQQQNQLVNQTFSEVSWKRATTYFPLGKAFSPVFSLLSMRNTLQFWNDWCSGSIYANLSNHFSFWSPLAASSSAMETNWFNHCGLVTSLASWICQIVWSLVLINPSNLNPFNCKPKTWLQTCLDKTWNLIRTWVQKMRTWNVSETLYMLDLTDALKTKTRTSTKSHVLPSRTCLEKGTFKPYLAGNWTNHMTITIYHG